VAGGYRSDGPCSSTSELACLERKPFLVAPQRPLEGCSEPETVAFSSMQSLGVKNVLEQVLRRMSVYTNCCVRLPKICVLKMDGFNLVELTTKRSRET
jgi:hypothetical protein